MQVVGDADVDDVDPIGSDEVLGGVECPLGAQLAAASALRAGVDAATPASCPPALRAARAWIRPTNPVPTMPTRGGVCFIGRDAI